MKKFTVGYRIKKYSALLFYVAAVIFLHSIGFGCISERFLHIECPGCGMSLAVVHLLHFRFAQAIQSHPMVLSLPVLLLYFILDGKVFGKKWDGIIIYTILGGFLVNWLIKLLFIRLCAG